MATGTLEVRLHAQAVSAVAPASLDWRRVGPMGADLQLSSRAGGPVSKVWYSADGKALYAQLPNGQIVTSTDGTAWTRATAVASPAARHDASLLSNPADVAKVVGGAVVDTAVSPVNPEEIVVASNTGVWRSMDGGITWAGLNDGLPSAAVRRLLAIGQRNRFLYGSTSSGRAVRWRAGSGEGWTETEWEGSRALRELQARADAALPGRTTVVARSGDTIYAGARDGTLFVSLNGGAGWRQSSIAPAGAAIERIVTDPQYASFGLAITAGSNRGRVLRTVNSGLFWDDITADLPTGTVSGVAADRESGAVYIATSVGLFMTYTDTVVAGGANTWTKVAEGVTLDVMLDRAGHQLYTIFEDKGVLAAMAPHRLRDPRVVSAADRVARAAAPGALLSVIGARIESAQSGNQMIPVLSATDTSSELQVPFEAALSPLTLSLVASQGRFRIGVPMQEASPGILVDREGSALLTDGESGLVVDSSNPARAGARLQVLATGLGRVTPSWPTGMAAPLENTPRVTAAVKAYLNGEPVEVTRATLAPGYTGLYLVEVVVPQVVNTGATELYIEAAGASSNRVYFVLAQ